MALDRLTGLLAGMRVGAVMAGAQDGPVLWLRGREGLTLGLGHAAPAECVVTAQLDWAGGGEALVAAGPYEMELARHDPVAGLARLVQAELAGPRCGAVPLLQGYVEALLVHLLRDVVARGPAGIGLMAGLADLRLARALVAMQGRPDQGWTTETLAAQAGMSRSAFMARFRDVMGEAPMSYLRRWRLARAGDDLARGARVHEVARRYGYANAGAFTRAFGGMTGQTPARVRKGVRAGVAISSARG